MTDIAEDFPATAGDVNGVAADRLRSIVERIERLEEEKAALTADVRDVYSEAKGAGFDTKTIRKIVKLRKMDRAAVQEEDALLELYRQVLNV